MSSLTTDLIDHHPDLATAVSLLDKWIAKRVHERQQPGVAAGIVYKGDLIWGKGYGLADVENGTPVTLDTRFRIASITKTFTAVAILQLRDAGKLRLDDPLSLYLDWFNLRYENAPEITLEHLLTHTSGLPRDANIPHWTDDSFQSWDELVQTTQQRKPSMPPLEDFSYSNLGYSLLGGVVETVSGQSWADYIQTQILNPLGMTDTLVVPAGNEPYLAQGYLSADQDYTRKIAPFAATNAFSPSASMASSVNDMVKYMGLHLSSSDHPLLSAYSLRDMHRVHWWMQQQWQSGYGLGTDVFRIKDWTITGHSGGYKGYITNFYMSREHQFGVILLTNSINSRANEYTEKVFKMVLPEVLKTVEAKKNEPKLEWSQYVGSYTNDWGNSEVVIRGGQLQIVYIDWLDETAIMLEPTDDPTVFTMKVPGNPGETARFELDAEGKVTRLFTRSEYSLRKA